MYMKLATTPATLLATKMNFNKNDTYDQHHEYPDHDLDLEFDLEV